MRSDPEHCGACGHSCLGRACVDGLCEPEQLAELASEASALVADDAGLFAASIQSVLQIPKDGSGSVQLALSEHEITDLALSADHVLWSSSWFEKGDRGRLERVPRAGGSAETLLEIGRGIQRIASVSNGVYLATDVDLRWFDGSAPGAAVVASLTFPITALAADDSAAYLVSDNDLIHFDPSTQTSVELASRSNITSIALDTDHVYFTNIETGTVNRIPRSGGAPAEIATGRTLPRALTADDEAVYWVEGDAVFGAVIKAPKNGSPPMALYCRVGVTAIRVDDAHLYIHSMLGSTGTIVSVPK